MTDLQYWSLKRQIRRLEDIDPDPRADSHDAVLLYTLKAAAMAYEAGVYPASEPLPGGPPA